LAAKSKRITKQLHFLSVHFPILFRITGGLSMQRGSRELWIAFLLIGIITFIYLIVVALTGSIPAASEFFGHSLGVLGLLLMVMTETLYSLRKRSRNANWGRMASWLNFHIITGLVGPFLALLHTSWKFNGLAGIVVLLTALVVLSGFIGRYIYTAVPRSADGIEIEAAVIEQQITSLQTQLDHWLTTQPESTRQLAARLSAWVVEKHSETGWVLGRYFNNLRFQQQWKREISRLAPSARAQAAQMEKMLRRRRQLIQQVESLTAVRRMLALWHAVHIPFGMALFTAAGIHIVAAIYYATLLH
jgi:hypothetical protein